MRVTVVGAGVAGLASALELAERGLDVEVVDRGSRLGAASCSWAAGGMLAPWCEGESAEAEVVSFGQLALDWWPKRFTATQRHGTLVLAAARDVGELSRFARRTERFEWADADRIAALEPDLAARFQKGLFFPEEAHLNPRRALSALARRLSELGVSIRFGVAAEPSTVGSDWIVDCRGFAARDSLVDLRGVRGEMLIVRCPDVRLSRPVRLLHPRMPFYVVPREDGCFMIGATMVESADRKGVTARASVELLNSAYALHAAFAEAEILEMVADIRPAFPDNLPRIMRHGSTFHLNGLFRHGFLLAPAYAVQVADALLNERETSHEHHRERRST